MDLKKEVLEQRELTTEELNEIIIDAILDKKGEEIIKMDLRGLGAPTDFFIVCQGNSNTQISSIADNITYKVKKKTGQLANHVEGKGNSTWVLVDYFTTVVHVFHPEARNFYGIEALWSDAVITEYQSI